MQIEEISIKFLCICFKENLNEEEEDQILFNLCSVDLFKYGIETPTENEVNALVVHVNDWLYKNGLNKRRKKENIVQQALSIQQPSIPFTFEVQAAIDAATERGDKLLSIEEGGAHPDSEEYQFVYLKRAGARTAS